MNAWQISTKVHDWMTRHIPRRSIVLELGGGTGSHALHTAFTTTTVEHDERWTRYLRRTGLSTHHAPLTRGWYDLTPELDRHLSTADVVVVDGPPGLLRKNIAPHLDRIKAGAFVIFDDSHRPEVRALITYPTVAVIRDGDRTTHVTKKPCPTYPSDKPEPRGLPDSTPTESSSNTTPSGGVTTDAAT
jgi:hypothetical protein